MKNPWTSCAWWGLHRRSRVNPPPGSLTTQDAGMGCNSPTWAMPALTQHAHTSSGTVGGSALPASLPDTTNSKLRTASNDVWYTSHAWRAVLTGVPGVHTARGLCRTRPLPRNCLWLLHTVTFFLVSAIMDSTAISRADKRGSEESRCWPNSVSALQCRHWFCS